MFAVVRTGGKQYRVAEGDIIAVEKIAGEAGDTVALGEVLLAGDGGKLEDSAGLTVSAEILEQGKGEKVLVFKKKRRHNYRRKNGHRQQLTVLKITGIGGAAKKAAPKKAAAKEAPAETAEGGAAEAKPAPAKKTSTAKSAAAPETTAKSETAKPKAPAKKTAKAKSEDKDA